MSVDDSRGRTETPEREAVHIGSERVIGVDSFARPGEVR
jgi:hypothetical protein